MMFVYVFPSPPPVTNSTYEAENMLRAFNAITAFDVIVIVLIIFLMAYIFWKYYPNNQARR